MFCRRLGLSLNPRTTPRVCHTGKATPIFRWSLPTPLSTLQSPSTSQLPLPFLTWINHRLSCGEIDLLGSRRCLRCIYASLLLAVGSSPSGRGFQHPILVVCFASFWLPPEAVLLPPLWGSNASWTKVSCLRWPTLLLSQPGLGPTMAELA